MRDPQHLERTYHGHRVISIQNMEPVENSDGWTHTVYDENKTLGLYYADLIPVLIKAVLYFAFPSVAGLSSRGLPIPGW